MGKRKAAQFFGILAAVLAVLTVVLSFTCRNANPIVLGGQSRAQKQVQALLRDVQAADAALVADYFTPGTDLAQIYNLDNPVAKELYGIVWKNLTYENVSKVRGDSASLALDVTVNAPDAAKLLASAKEQVRPLVNASIESGTDTETMYDEDFQLREEFLNEILLEALERVKGDIPFRQERITVYIRRSDSGWEILPEDGLIDALSGWIRE